MNEKNIRNFSIIALVKASSVSFAQAKKPELTHSTAFSLPKVFDFLGTPLTTASRFPTRAEALAGTLLIEHPRAK